MRDRLSGGLLNRLGKLTHLSTVLLIGRSHQQTLGGLASRIDGCMHFPALASLGSIITRMVATDRGVDGKVRLAKKAAEGCRLRPLASRSTKGRSSTRAVKQPAANRALWFVERQRTRVANHWASGNLTLWLKSCGLYDRKSTESSNMAIYPSSHAAPDLCSGFGYL
jgi:hypothetical protein